MQINKASSFNETTHEGAPAARMTSEQALRRSVLACMLWEDTFYEQGEDIALRIERLVDECSLSFVAELAIRARSEYNLRHVPLLLVACMAKRGGALVRETLYNVIQRADELCEFVAIYWRNGKRPLSAQVKKGLAQAFLKFDAYQLAKYNRDRDIKLRDVMFLVHPKAPSSMSKTFKQLADGTLPSPDTWEVALSEGKEEPAAMWKRLIAAGNLGYMALLRNLRNMEKAGVPDEIIRQAILARKNGADRLLPFRFVSAARVCPRFEPEIDLSLRRSINKSPGLMGRTAVLVDVSGSMHWATVSGKSSIRYIDAAAALASIINAEQLRVFTFSQEIVEVPPRSGMAGVDTIISSQFHQGTNLGYALAYINNNVPCDRLIVITDEQSQKRVPDPVAKLAYMINVSTSRNGVGYDRWTHIDGFSEQTIRFIYEFEILRN